MSYLYHGSFFSDIHMSNFGFGVVHAAFLILSILVWVLVRKGWALWLAARRNESFWFIALLIINTMGILEIFYIFAIAKQKDVKEEISQTMSNSNSK